MSIEAITSRIPRLVKSCDVRRLPLSPTQGYVLSRIDGMVSVIELALMTGLSREDVDATITKLVELGAVTVGDTPAEAAPPSEPGSSSIAAEAMKAMQGPVVESYTIPPAAEEAARSRSLYDPSELDEDVDIPEEKRRQILDLFYQLDTLTHYEVLGVERTADKKAVKEAYFRLAAEYHPDRYFRKNLGSFKGKMEAVFSLITIAHDTLTKKGARAEYDAYIEAQQQTRQLEAFIRGTDTPREMDSLRKAIADRTPAEPAPSPSPGPIRLDASHVAMPPPPMSGQGGSSVPPVREVTSSTPPVRALISSTPPMQDTGISRPPDSAGAYGSTPPRDAEKDRMRREALARRLMGPRVSRPPSVRPPPTRAAAESAAADLKRRYAEKQAAMRRAQLKEAVKMAEEATQREDLTSAANAYRLALELAPEDAELKQQLAEAQSKSLQVLAKNYVKQAQYEERSERWKEAARSYARAAEVMKDDASVQERTANAMVHAGLDLHSAAQFATKAVELEPKKAEFRATLALVFIAAGLKLNARRELEIAAEIAPENANIAKLLKSVR